ncbi:hypothetical protein PybrP1_005700 [[Pythium] brassicae (nom. inval.)]|nr:hypothetical protein PybrP1_005700 [[Pythium] brassicae (nom. inval.)]
MLAAGRLARAAARQRWNPAPLALVATPSEPSQRRFSHSAQATPRNSPFPTVSAARMVSGLQQQQQQQQQRKPTLGKQSAREKAEADAQLEELLASTRARGFEPTLDFLRAASRVLQLCKTREQLVAALPLCRVVEAATILHGTAAMECVRVYQRLGRHREVVALAERLFANDFFLMNPVLVNAIQACAALGDVRKGLALFETAVARGTIPNLPVFSALLALCGAAGDKARVQLVLVKMAEAGLEMTHFTYHALMSAYLKGGRADEAIALFADLTARGLAPDEHSYAILMDAHGERGDCDAALALLAELQAPGSAVTPNLVHYNVLLKACGKAGRLPTAFQLYEEMKAAAIAPDHVTYITMMHAVFHGELGEVDARAVKGALAGVGLLGAASLLFIDFQEHYLSVLFSGSLVGSMALAAYLHPDGVLRALYPNADEPRTEPVIAAFFRRLREEDHCGRSMYLWREMRKFGVAPDPRVYDVLVRTCVKKRHPELAFEAVFEEQLPLADAENGGAFVLSLPTTVQFLHALLAQRRAQMADALYEAGLAHGVFASVFEQTRSRHVYDLRAFGTGQVRSFVVEHVLAALRRHAAAEARVVDAVELPRVDFLVLHGYELLDQLDADSSGGGVRELFSMDDMKREASASGSSAGGQYHFRLRVSGARLKEFFATTTGVKEQRL